MFIIENIIPNDIVKIIQDMNIKLIQYVNAKEIVIEDEFGYRYKAQNTYLRKNKLPHKYRQNPYVIHNIRNYLKLNFPQIVLVSKEYKNIKSALEIICKDHLDKGIQSTTLENILNFKYGCKYCGADARGEQCRISESEIVKRLEELNLIYYGRFNKNQETWIRFICPCHIDKGIQEIAWYHLKTCSKGCAYCTGRYKTTNDFANELNNINPDVKVLGEYIGSESPIDVKCLVCGHHWNPIGRSLLNGQGCPNCSMSKGEKFIKTVLDSHQIEYISQHTFDDCRLKQCLRFDFYLPDYNVIIEYDGEQHFYPVDFGSKGSEWAENAFKLNQKKDQTKDKYCLQKGINLIRIPYTNYNNIPDIITEKIIS